MGGRNRPRAGVQKDDAGSHEESIIWTKIVNELKSLHTLSIKVDNAEAKITQEERNVEGVYMCCVACGISDRNAMQCCVGCWVWDALESKAQADDFSSQTPPVKNSLVSWHNTLTSSSLSSPLRSNSLTRQKTLSY